MKHLQRAARLLLAVLATAGFLGTAQAQTLDVVMSFSPPTIVPGGISTLTLRVINNSPTARNALASYIEAYPTQITNVGIPFVSSGPCITSGTAGNSFITFSMVSGSLPPGGICEFQVTVTSTVVGTHTNVFPQFAFDLLFTPPLSGPPAPVIASLTVVAPIITTTADSGAGSLRDAIAYVNANCGTGPHTLTFDIPSAGPHTILPVTPLPAVICNSTTIDGYSQPGASPNTVSAGYTTDAVIKVALSGASCPTCTEMLTLLGTGITVRGLAIHSVPGNAITIGSSNAMIAGNFIGMLPDGITPAANTGIGILGSGSTHLASVGTGAVGDRNLISGNSGAGIVLSGNNIAVHNNLIGGDRNAGGGFGNLGGGVRQLGGIFLWVEGNRFVGNGGEALYVGGTSTDAHVTTNEFAGNFSAAVRVVSGSAHLIELNQILGNVGIGIDVVGAGVVIQDNTVFNSNADGIRIAGNYNTIRYNNVQANSLGGVRIESGVENVITENSIFTNVGAGIILGTGAGGTPNDEGPPHDIDSGPNSLVNHPVITSVTHAAGQTTINWTLKSGPPGTSFAVEFYANASLVGPTRGETWLGTQSSVLDPNGEFVFSLTIPGLHSNVTATATIDTCASGCNETSEFSPAVAATLAPGVLQVLPPSLTFGGTVVAVASPVTQIAVTNQGPGVVNIASITVSGEFQFTHTCGSAIAVSVTCFLDVTFLPLALGVRNGSLVINSDATVSPLTIPLSGTGVAAPLPVLQVIPSPDTFPGQTVGTISPTRSYNVTNLGPGTVNLTSITVTGEFTLALNGCGATLAASASCVLNVDFRPLALGLRSGSIIIVSNATVSPLTVPLTGTGLAPPAPVLQVLPASLAFADQTVGTVSTQRTVNVTNLGPGIVSFSGIASAGEFSFVSTCGATLALSASCTLLVDFRPLMTGLRTGSIMVSSNATVSPVVVGLSGQGIAAGVPALSVDPAALDFGAVLVGSVSEPRTFSLTNTGDGPLDLSEFFTTSPVFRVVVGIPAALAKTVPGNTCSSRLPPRQTCVVNVEFAPVRAGDVAESLFFDTNLVPRSRSFSLRGRGTEPTPVREIEAPAALDFGNQILGLRSTGRALAVRNLTAREVALLEVSVTGDFQVGDTCRQVPAGARCDLVLTFLPMALGRREGSLTLRTANDPRLHVASLSGNGIPNPVPQLSFSALAIGFGAVIGPTTLQVGVTNTGQLPVLLDGVFATGGFMAFNRCPLTLAPGGQCVIDITFLPVTPGGRSGELIVISNAQGSPHRMSLSATGCRLPSAGIGRSRTLLCG